MTEQETLIAYLRYNWYLDWKNNALADNTSYTYLADHILHERQEAKKEGAREVLEETRDLILKKIVAWDLDINEIAGETIEHRNVIKDVFKQIIAENQPEVK